ncbi:hypothetical protein CTAYLR_006567 [Chrysophaeum taylorii]|uniref:GYF domain-containing protein n=1 Tax=Chrysophaeum taylorii TaxID=2483200 RepID=A0AAD7XLL1_9STRA|nr:hypothetical protein CTAYLR_006567 [Chrysophaeum taylorii]
MMQGGSLWRTLQRSKAERENTVSVDAQLEASRRRNAEETARARERLNAERKEREEAAAVAAAKQAGLAAHAVAVEGVALERLTAVRDPRAAVGWYYVDAAGKKQGPFAPQQMRDWFTAGYLPRDLRVAPAFANDRVPQHTDMERLDKLFDEPLTVNAFRSAHPSDQPAPKKRKRDEPPKETGNWLVDSINRQKAGIHRLRHDRHDGPGMVFDDA